MARRRTKDANLYSKSGNTQYMHSTFLSAQKCIHLKLKAKNACFGLYAINMC